MLTIRQRIPRVAIGLVLSSTLAACNRQPSPPAEPARVGTTDPRAEAAALASLSIHVQKDLGAGSYLIGFSVKARPDGHAWRITLVSRVQIAPRTTVWVHAYAPGRTDYEIVDPSTPFQQPRPGEIVNDTFDLTQAGAFDLYAGEMGPDGGLGPAVPLGWIAVGDPASPAFAAALKVLEAKGAFDRAGVMLDEALRDRSGVDFPEDVRLAIYARAGRFDVWLPYYEKRLAEGWRPAGIDDWLSLTAATQAARWKDDRSALDAVLRDVSPARRAPAAMADAARRRARNQSEQEVAPRFPLPFTPPVTILDGLEIVGATIVPVARPPRYQIYLFMRAGHDVRDNAPIWLHAYPEGGGGYEDAIVQPVAHPARLGSGDYTWRSFAVTRLGAYNVYVGSTGPDGSLGPAQSLGWMVIGQPASAGFAKAVRQIAARGASARAQEIVTWALQEYPEVQALQQLRATLADPLAAKPH